MKKHFTAGLLLTLMASASFAQMSSADLPASTIVTHYRLAIGYNSTTVLIFAAPVKPVDRGDRDVLALKQPGVENVLKLKAARRNFPATNLHVFTQDGRIYAFDISYTDSLASTRDLTLLVTGFQDAPVRPAAILSKDLINTADISRHVAVLDSLPAHRTGPVNKNDKMSFRIAALGQAESLLFFRFRLANRSNLDYNLGFLRFYIRDRQKAKRTSIQEQEIQPVFRDSTGYVAGKSAIFHSVALPAFTLAGGKELVIEAYEQNGGRSLSIRLHNRSLFRARKL